MVQWEFMTLLEPQKSSASLVYMGYPGDTSTAFQITRRKKYDQKKQRSQRGVVQCFVFGPPKAGKSAILDALIGRYVLSYFFSYCSSQKVCDNFQYLDLLTKSK
jgi:Ras family protein T1